MCADFFCAAVVIAMKKNRFKLWSWLLTNYISISCIICNDYNLFISSQMCTWSTSTQWQQHTSNNNNNKHYVNVVILSSNRFIKIEWAAERESEAMWFQKKRKENMVCFPNRPTDQPTKWSTFRAYLRSLDFLLCAAINNILSTNIFIYLYVYV